MTDKRVIIDNDGGDVFYCTGSSYEEFTALRLKGLIGSGATTLFYTTISSGFGVFSHNTKIGAMRLYHEDRHPRNIVPELLEQGTDCLHYVERFCRENGLELFWGMRMNDTHDGTGASYSAISFENNPWKLSHMHCLLGTPENKPRFGTWTAVNYSCPEVRELAVALVEEVCRNYDVDGVHLDFFRHPIFFPSVAAGLPATETEIALMTGLMADIKHVTDEAAARRGRPVLISVRVPDSVPFCRFIGLDIEKWLESGYVSLLCTSSYLLFNDWEYSVKLGHRYNVPVYPALDETRIADKDANTGRTQSAGMRGRCANVYGAGADGVMLFNYIFDAAYDLPERYKVIKEISERETLRMLPKRFYGSFRGISGVAGGCPPHRDYIAIPVLNPSAPLEFTNYGRTSVYVGESFEDGESCTLNVSAQPFQRLLVSVNGYTIGVLPESGELPLQPSVLVTGRNVIEFETSGNASVNDLFIERR